jgi:Holliday junction resolvasome RuvABC DNA-binding subunit
MEIRGIGDKVAAQIHTGGYLTPVQVALEEDANRFAALTGLDSKKAKQIVAAAKKWLAQRGVSAEEAVEHEEIRAAWLTLNQSRYDSHVETHGIPEADAGGSDGADAADSDTES